MLSKLLSLLVVMNLSFKPKISFNLYTTSITDPSLSIKVQNFILSEKVHWQTAFTALLSPIITFPFSYPWSHPWRSGPFPLGVLDVTLSWCLPSTSLWQWLSKCCSFCRLQPQLIEKPLAKCFSEIQFLIFQLVPLSSVQQETSQGKCGKPDGRSPLARAWLLKLVLVELKQ